VTHFREAPTAAGLDGVDGEERPPLSLLLSLVTTLRSANGLSPRRPDVGPFEEGQGLCRGIELAFEEPRGDWLGFTPLTLQKQVCGFSHD
jgi:hypothetical protein